MIGEGILLRLSRKPGTRDYPGGTLNTNVDNALEFLCKTVPQFVERITNKTVLDFGCGWGRQSVAMALIGTKRVVGVDIQALDKARELARERQCEGKLTFVHQIPPETRGTFDVVLSCSSFEHFEDPVGVLRQMCEAAKPGGSVIISFAEPWYSPHGSHMNFFTKLPYVNLLFFEEAVMKVRSNFRQDGALRYEDVEGGLNRMTVAKFERIIQGSGMQMDFFRCYPVKGMPWVERLPVLRELLVASVACVLRNVPQASETSRTGPREPATRSAGSRRKGGE